MSKLLKNKAEKLKKCNLFKIGINRVEEIYKISKLHNFILNAKIAFQIVKRKIYFEKIIKNINKEKYHEKRDLKHTNNLEILIKQYQIQSSFKIVKKIYYLLKRASEIKTNHKINTINSFYLRLQTMKNNKKLNKKVLSTVLKINFNKLKEYIYKSSNFKKDKRNELYRKIIKTRIKIILTSFKSKVKLLIRRQIDQQTKQKRVLFDKLKSFYTFQKTLKQYLFEAEG